MKRSVAKQTLTTLDEPAPIPAVLDLDLSYAAQTFQPGTFERTELPDSLPVFSERTGKLKRFVRPRATEKNERRVVSMPSFSKLLQKALPKPPSQSVKSRPVSMGADYMKNNLPTVEEEESDEASSFRSPEFLSCSSSICSQAIDSEFQSAAKHVIIDDNEEIDSLFSSVSRSTAPSDDSHIEVSQTLLAKNILELVEIYETDSPDVGSISSDNFFDDGSVKLDEVSVKDSLFSEQASMATKPLQKDLPQVPPKETKEVPKETKELPPVEEIKVQKRSPKSVPIETKVQPQQKEPKPPQQTLNITKTRASPKVRPVSMYTVGSNSRMSYMSNHSCTSTMSNMSLSDMKSEIKKQVRQRPFSYCLDAGNDYGYSKYSLVPKPRAVSSNPYKDPLFSPPKMSTPLVKEMKKPSSTSQSSRSSASFHSPRTSIMSEADVHSEQYMTPPSSPMPPSSSTEKDERIKKNIASFLTKQLYQPPVPPKDTVEDRANRFVRASH